MALMMLPGRRGRGRASHDRDARHWLLTLTSGAATEADAEAFRAWLRADPGHEAAFAEQKRLWQALGPAVREEAAARATTRRPSRSGRRAFLGGAVAASAAYLAWRPPLGLWPGLDELGADYRTATGEQRRVALGDALELELNTQTRINVRSAAASAGAVIELAAGEAEVRVGRQADANPALPAPVAQVVAGAGRVSAREALFNLRYLGGEASLCCLAGSVQLAHSQGTYEVGAGQELRYDDRRVMPPAKVNTEAVTAWRRGWLVFDRVPLADVVDELNRYRRGRLVLLNRQLGQRRVQARFALAQVADAEQLIRDAYGAEVTRLPGGVVLLS
ncbi:iron dicitrate transport regulator FecR [Achromobacter denitrificans]|nr:iron dicitrate transport regulator FecR [Achromobacter denitrificans]